MVRRLTLDQEIEGSKSFLASQHTRVARRACRLRQGDDRTQGLQGGRTKEALRLDAWARDLGPSTQLRKWFGHDPARWPEFQSRYHAELAEADKAQALDALASQARRGPVTLVYGARDREHNQARVIADELERRIRD